MMKIAMTGTSGNMGREALAQTMELPQVELCRVLLTNKKKNEKLALQYQKKYGKRIEILRGTVADRELCKRLVEGMDYVLHMAAVIPPKSDADFQASYECNYLGAAALADAIKAQPVQPSYIHISTVALYGNRNEKHPWGRVGDPLLISPLDAYALHKLMGERYVLEAGLKRWAVLRQTAMLYPEMLTANMRDGLMFHTALNAPLEWISSRDSGTLIRRIFERESRGEIPGFWNNIYNIGAGKGGRDTGYDTFCDGFSLIGGSPEKFFCPDWLSARNFHGVWFSDGDELESLFGYQRDGVSEFWKEIGRRHKYFALAKLVPKKLIQALVFRRLLRHPNSPRRWIEDGDKARIRAYFGGEEGVKALPRKWREVKLLAKGDFGDYDLLRDDQAIKPGALLSHGYDESKPWRELSIEDMHEAAAFRGGKCLSKTMRQGDLEEKLWWECSEGHIFESSPKTVLRGGHWCPKCAPLPWNFDKLSKKSPFYAQVWYDSHGREENFVYDMNEKGEAFLSGETK